LPKLLTTLVVRFTTEGCIPLGLCLAQTCNFVCNQGFSFFSEGKKENVPIVTLSGSLYLLVITNRRGRFVLGTHLDKSTVRTCKIKQGCILLAKGETSKKILVANSIFSELLNSRTLLIICKLYTSIR
jgi:hypothetical protein